MFKMLVADDERYIREGIISILKRNLLEPVQYIEAKNGVEALEKTVAEIPDLIITDINMPGCDGLEYVKKLKEKQVNTVVIILSGYENFEYAKSAITLGIKEYVMKPIKKAEFIELITRHMGDIKGQQLKAREEIESKIKNNKIIEKVKEAALIGLLKCTDYKMARQYLKQLEELKVSFEPWLCTCVAFQYEVNEENREYIDFAVKNILNEHLSAYSEDFLLNVTFDRGIIISLFKCGRLYSKGDAWKKVIRKSAGLIKKYAGVKVFAGIGDVVPDFEHLNVSLRHAMCAMAFKIFDRGDILCAYNEIEKGNEIQLAPLRRQDNLLEIWGELNRIYSVGQTKAVLDALIRRYNETMDFIKSQIAKKATAIKWEEMEYKEFYLCQSLDEMKQEIKKGFNQLEEVSQKTGTINIHLMEQVIQFVNENITKDLDLRIIAEEFNRTPGYLSTMFKRYTEGGFSAYVTQKRMEIARNLLRDKDIPIRKIAETCGYYNTKYFSVVFKKSIGKTPREYREKFHK